MRSLPCLANSGMKSQTRSSRWSTCFSSSLWITIAVIALLAEKMSKGVSVLTESFGASGGSCGALPRAWPIARFSTTTPWRRTHSESAGCTPVA